MNEKVTKHLVELLAFIKVGILGGGVDKILGGLGIYKYTISYIDNHDGTIYVMKKSIFLFGKQIIIEKRKVKVPVIYSVVKDYNCTVKEFYYKNV